MPATTRILSESLKSDKAKAGKTPSEETPVYETNIPEPECRADLIKYWFNLSLDEKTANSKLWIREDGAKVARITDNVRCPVLERPERYEYVPQVLCKEGIHGFRGYWEVEISGWVVVGVAYERAGRRNTEGPCGFGENEESWGLGWSGSSYQAWHNSKTLEIMEIPKCSTIGVYLDQPAGILNFYAVEVVEEGGENAGEKEVKLLQQVRSSFTEKMIPGFWVGTQSHCLIKKVDE
ncbi:stonustoxin subunit beta-like [Brachionichthys hirsutus]|uniref:stonustoxin subunit beta-like n=1 Tax=Brachionichthys hirsutus TaxID=412623 RepID=UPI003604BBBE